MDATRVEVAPGVRLHVGVTGAGPDVLVLSGGPGCVHYLENDELAPANHRSWYPEPRGVGRSQGTSTTMLDGIADLEAVRVAQGITSWTVLGHSWGADLALRYSVLHPVSVSAVVGIAGRGPQRDATWSAAYEAGLSSEPVVDIVWNHDVHATLRASFTEWTQQPSLWRDLADCRVRVHLVAAGDDIRLPWPMQQLAELLPAASLETVPAVPHNFWSTHPGVWTDTVNRALRIVGNRSVRSDPGGPEQA